MHTRNNIIPYNHEEDWEKVTKGLRIGDTASVESRETLIGTFKKYWNCFHKKGTCCTIFGYEFAINPGTPPPVCCKVPRYGPHESSIIMNQIADLLENDWIKECKVPWWSQIVLVEKPHQEHIENIEDFDSSMCVSYYGLNKFTRPFVYQIPRCDKSISITEVGSYVIYIITIDMKPG